MNAFNFPMSPERASNFAGEYDAIFYTLTILTIVFTVLVAGLVIFFAVRYREGTKVDRSRPIYEHLPLELTWTIIPLLLGLVVFFFGTRLFIDMRTPPKDAMDIYVIGKQWMWHAQHAPSGVRENNTLHVPVGKPVRLTMISQDVIHAFYIPEFRVQYHVVPGRYTTQWFTATKPGVYHLFCGMYCGTQHSEMGGYVYAMEPKDYAEWIASGGNDVKPMTMEQRGAAAFNQLGCNNCHSDKDTDRAPSLIGLMGKQRKFTDGSGLVADEDYIRKSIIDPYDHITAGYQNTMSAYNTLNEEQILELVAYIKTLGTTAEPKVPATTDDIHKGLETTGANYKAPPRSSANAIGYTGPKKAGPNSRNLAVGAISMEEKEANRQ
ncbi:MAG: cytochrome c oxidase subunit II [Armatimonadetes bacterium 55-13]|nr:cytochrome c oxidase subunit II [Armatimonadota bacterium]OJU64374.1 MAG: cytochrome c oxidase subunit II [Armatimonadetes bacterium 55-13]